MRTIGLLGGMSWESTVLYYQVINRVVARELGGLHSAEILLDSVDFHEIEGLQREGRWDDAGDLLAGRARRLEAAGAGLLVLCTNTMHKVAPRIEAALGVPLLHIADATGRAVERAGLRTVGLLGTRFTMEEPFYRGRLEERFGLRTVVPEAADRQRVDRVIYGELCHGQVLDTSRADFRRVIAGLVERGAQGVILGCTEIGLLVGPEDATVSLFDTARIHAEQAALECLRADGLAPPVRPAALP
jgi:aspartate racemase